MRYKLNASNIDAVSKEVNAYLVRRNTEDKDRVHTKLSVEEVLLDYMSAFGSDAEFTLEYDGGLSRSRIRLMVPGEPLDPFASTETDSEDGLYLASVLSAMGQRPKWKYIRGVNTITYTPAKKRRLSQIATILIGLLCGTVAGLLIQTLALSIFVLSIGAPGVPGAVLVCLSILLPQIGVPSEAISLIMGLYALVGMILVCTNVTGDAVMTLIVGKQENQVDLKVYNS